MPVSDAMVPIVAVNVAAESREQGGTQQGRVRTPVVWGQGIPLRPAVTIRRPTSAVPDRAAVVPTNQYSATPPDSSALASVSDAITRLQRERDLALRRIDELHVHYKKEIKATEESHARRESTVNRDYLKVSGDLEVTKR